MPSSISEQDHLRVQQLLGREPRGLVGVPVRTKTGEPVVIQVSSLVDGKPFPTLFWLVDKTLNLAIDKVEARGLIATLQAQVDDSSELQSQLVEDHQAYIRLRQAQMDEQTRQQVIGSPFEEALAKRGIGGIADFGRIRCLHTYYAAHLVVPNTVGKLLDDYWQEHDITFPHL